MSYYSKNILSQISFAPDAPVSVYFGDPYPGDGYYGKSDGLHTFQYSVTNLEGTLVIQATLVFEPTESDWSTVYSKEYELIEESANHIQNIVGNYVWVRAGVIDWKHGSINVIRMKH